MSSWQVDALRCGLSFRVTQRPGVTPQVVTEGVDGVALKHAVTSASATAAGVVRPCSDATPDASPANGSQSPLDSTASPAAQSTHAQKALAGLLPAPSPGANGLITANAALPASNGHLPPQSHWAGGHGNQAQSQPPALSAVAAQSSSNSSATSSPQRPAWNSSELPAASSWPVQSVVSSFALPSKQGGVGPHDRESVAQLPVGVPPKSLVLPLGSSPPRVTRSVLGKRQDSEAESELDHELMVSLIPDLGIGLSPSRLVTGQGAENSQEGVPTHRFPSRKGHPICDFYQKTGHCKVRRPCLRLLL